jgi:hypothetical protein
MVAKKREAEARKQHDPGGHGAGPSNRTPLTRMLVRTVRSMRLRGHRGFYSPKMLQMIVQLRKSCFGGAEVSLNSLELGAARWIRLATVDIYEECR